MGAGWLITGAYQRLGDRLRVTAKLIDAHEGTIVQTVKIDGTAEEIFDLQDRVVPELTSGLGDLKETPKSGEPAPELVTTDAHAYANAGRPMMPSNGTLKRWLAHATAALGVVLSVSCADRMEQADAAAHEWRARSLILNDASGQRDWSCGSSPRRRWVYLVHVTLSNCALGCSGVPCPRDRSV